MAYFVNKLDDSVTEAGLGDRTMVDALAPALNELSTGLARVATAAQAEAVAGIFEHLT